MRNKHEPVDISLHNSWSNIEENIRKFDENLENGEIEFIEFRNSLGLLYIQKYLEQNDSKNYEDLALVKSQLALFKSKVIIAMNKESETELIGEYKETQEFIQKMIAEIEGSQNQILKDAINTRNPNVLFEILLNLDVKLEQYDNTVMLGNIILDLNELIVQMHKNLNEYSKKNPSQINSLTGNTNQLMLEAIDKLIKLATDIRDKCIVKQEQKSSVEVVSTKPRESERKKPSNESNFRKAMAEISTLLTHIKKSDKINCEGCLIKIQSYLSQIDNDHEIAGILRYLSSIKLDESDKNTKFLHKELESLLAYGKNKIKNIETQELLIQEPLTTFFERKVKAAISNFNELDTHDPLINVINEYNPENKTPEHVRYATSIAREIGLHSRLAYLKRKIYSAQIIGSQRKAVKFMHKVESYLHILENARSKIDQSNTKLIGVIDAEIIYAKSLIMESKKVPTSVLKVKRIQSLFSKNPQRKKSEAIANSIESLHHENRQLYENSVTPKLLINHDEIRDVFRTKMQELYTQHTELYKQFKLAFSYETQSHKRGNKLKPKEVQLAKRLPALTAEVVHVLNILNSNINPSELASALATYNPITKDSKRVLEHELVRHIQRTIDKDSISLNTKSVFDIFRGSSPHIEKKNQGDLNRELLSAISENMKLNKIKIEQKLENYFNLSKKERQKVDKEVASLLGLRQFNDLLKREVVLNIALSDKHGNLATLGKMSQQFDDAVTSCVNSLEPVKHHQALVQILQNEAECAGKVNTHINKTLPKLTFGEKTIGRAISLARAKKAAEHIKTHPRDWVAGNPPKGTVPNKNGGSSTPPPPAQAV